MPPFPIHAVPDEELYTGSDGVQRPYGMQYGADSPFAHRARKAVPETGSFGKSTRRSRSKSGTPAVKREDPSQAAVDKIFASHFEKEAERRAQNPARKAKLSTSVSQSNTSTSNALTTTEGNGETSQRYVHKEPTEVVLRGYKQGQQYAAINQFERVAGRICEDYPRDAPIEQRKYKGDQRDPAILRTKPLTVEEKAKALRFAGGENWIKITFESAEAAEIAIASSPQPILGHLVYAELYRGVPPSLDDAIPAGSTPATPRGERLRPSGSVSRSQPTPGNSSISPPASMSSSQTIDTGTISHGSSSSATITNPPAADGHLYCRKIPTARRIQLLPAELALLPQPSYGQRLLSNIPFLRWLSSDIIGREVPRTELGDFDHDRASLYWKIIWWIDTMTGWFDLKIDKDE
ncbi:hypothetical protein B0O99DRAFT_608435 [Bisporella sp. PMI_857]|nr:hypothetical protein B0O99DRAFT_608435 [Bisporella sp. PMI_857]